MNKFIISAENTCDLPKALSEEIGVKILNLHFSLDGEEYPFENFGDGKDFYGKLRKGAVSSTSQANIGELTDFFKSILDEGYDVLHLAFAGVLSGTYGNATLVAEKLREEYPERKISVIDSKSQSGGQGLLLYLVSKKRDDGATFEECEEYALSMIQRINHVFTINDLRSLMRTGRVSGAEAFLGTILQIKPLLYTDSEGRLTPYQKIISRKLALNALCDKVKALYDGDCKTMFIMQSDCVKDAEYVSARLKSATGVEDIRIFSLGPVIGCHTGAETVAIFFTAKSRDIKPKG